MMNTVDYTKIYLATQPIVLKAELSSPTNKIELVKINSSHTIVFSIILVPMVTLLLIALITEIDALLNRRFRTRRIVAQLQRIIFLERLLKIDSHQHD
jgi:hypothetical protein